MGEEIVTVSAKVPLELQNKLDKIQVVLNLENRSEVIRRGLEHFIKELERKEYTKDIHKNDNGG
jgi:metal-responsive CopG/Arc/MetJ family transcriptional regulator